ncbi:MAG: LysM peptidoglycan-binding domain-containing protein [Pseudonocardiaceae bacterium]
MTAPATLRTRPTTAGPTTSPPIATPAPSACGRVQAGHLPAPRQPRVVHLVTAVAVTLAVTVALGWLGQLADAGIPAETAVVRVGAGETVWDVAQRVAPESDPPTVVQRIRELNGMTGSAVQPGQQLQVPDGR